MATALNVKRKNIDLPTDILRKLSIMAAAAGKSLKKYIEETMIDKANSTNIAVYENPSPSGDTWFDDPENMAAVMRGIEDAKAGRCREVTADEIRDMLGV
ncbi:MAG: hypothetical protein K2K45_05745 [Muribaculaceae bacterium]|nr:hypothetical protein [Muribaculaceae bacterium]